MRKQTIGVAVATALVAGAVGIAGTANAAEDSPQATFKAVNDQIGAHTDSNGCQYVAGPITGSTDNKSSAFWYVSQTRAADLQNMLMTQHVDEPAIYSNLELLRCLNIGFASAYLTAVNATDDVHVQKAKTLQATKAAEVNKQAATKNAAELAKQFRYKYQTGNRLQRLCEKKAVKKSKSSRKLCKQMAYRLGKPTKIYSVNSQGRLVAKSVIR